MILIFRQRVLKQACGAAHEGGPKHHNGERNDKRYSEPAGRFLLRGHVSHVHPKNLTPIKIATAAIIMPPTRIVSWLSRMSR